MSSERRPPLGIRLLCVLYAGFFAVGGAWMAAMVYGLWTFKPWAVTVTLGFFAYTAIQALVTGELVQVGLAALLAAYVFHRREYYRSANAATG
jgi:hypothetical protein